MWVHGKTVLIGISPSVPETAGNGGYSWSVLAAPVASTDLDIGLDPLQLALLYARSTRKRSTRIPTDAHAADESGVHPKVRRVLNHLNNLIVVHCKELDASPFLTLARIAPVCNPVADFHVVEVAWNP